MAQSGKWGFVALTVVLVLAASALVGRSQSSADGKAAAAGSRFTMSSEPLGDKRIATMIIDAETMRLLVYAFDVNKNQMRLVAVRDLSQDMSLSRYNNARPWPEDIRKMLEAEKRGEETPAETPTP